MQVLINVSKNSKPKVPKKTNIAHMHADGKSSCTVLKLPTYTRKHPTRTFPIMPQTEQLHHSNL
jgi:hypothetical protein